MRPESTLWRARLFFLLLALLVAGAVINGLLSRNAVSARLDDAATAQRIRTVALVEPTAVAAGFLELPARLEAWARAPIYARVSGYLKKWNVDIGGKVRAGQLLGEIDTPDIDQQLLQARAELATARSSVALADSTATRWKSLLATDAVSRQEADEKAGDFAGKQSVVQALQANVDRVSALQRYTRLLAPFDGVVTARNTDVGALIGVGGAAGTELFVVSDVRRIRVYVSVPQRQLVGVQVGGKALLSVPERPGKTYAATVQSLSGAINSATGAMLVQLAVDNPSGELVPGGFARVRFESPGLPGTLGIPPGALIVGKKGVQVAVVDAQQRARLKDVIVARDLGNQILLAQGVDARDRVISNPPDGLEDGDEVRIATAETPKP